METNTDAEKLLELTAKEQTALQELLAEWIRDVAQQNYYGSWENSLGAFQDTEIEEVFDEALIPLNDAVDSAFEHINRIPKSLWVNKEPYKAIMKQRKETTQEVENNQEPQVEAPLN